MEFTIRRPKKINLSQISALFNRTVKNNFKEEGSLDLFKAEADQLIQDLIETLNIDFRTNGKEEYHLIAVDKKETILGTIGYGKPNSIIAENLKMDKEYIPEIKSVYILPEFQGNGIGSKLFETILTELAQKDIKSFCLDSGFKKAQQFWSKKLGEPIMTLTDYWAQGVDHMIWLKGIGE